MAEIDKAHGTDRDVSSNELSYRLGQQRVLADFGAEALRSPDSRLMLSSAARLAAEGMRSHLAKVLQYSEATQELLVVAGVGWDDGVVGNARMGADTGSPGGYAFQTGESVISNHLDRESKFRTPQFMIDHGVSRAINILIQVHGKKWGVLEVDSTQPGKFGSADLAFLKGLANLVGVAIERQNVEEELRKARKHQELLTREASHRVKNSLAIVSAMLGLQKGDHTDPEIASVLSDAQKRIGTVATAHDLLWQGETVGTIDLADIIPRLCETIQQAASQHEVTSDVQPAIVAADTGIPVGLMVNELVTNAVKYAYPGSGGPIYVKGQVASDRYVIEISDEGEGFPIEFDKKTDGRSGLGMRLVRSLSNRINADTSFSEPGIPGRVKISFPLPPIEA